MPESKLYVIAKITALPHKVEEVKSLLLQLLEPTRKEKGCIRYELFQNQADSTEFTFLEEWTDKISMNEHLASEHIQNTLKQCDGLLVASSDIRLYNFVG